MGMVDSRGVVEPAPVVALEAALGVEPAALRSLTECAHSLCL